MMLNKKKEAIRKAYGDGWARLHPELKECALKLNGFIHRESFISFLGYRAWGDAERKRVDGDICCRPKSLAGIENNNGWIAIKSDDDLPKDSYNYWVRQSDGIITSIRQYDDNKKYWDVTATHYQPIIKPLPPVY